MRRDQAADDGAGAHGGHEGAVEPAAAVEGELGQQRQGDGEVEGEDADDGHGEQRDPQIGGGPDVAQPLAHLPLGPTTPGRRYSSDGAHHGQRHDHRRIGGRVDEEARGHAHGEDEHPADGRPDDPGPVHQHAVEADRVGQEVAPDHLGDEGLAGRVVEEVHERRARRQHVHLPQA